MTGFSRLIGVVFAGVVRVPPACMLSCYDGDGTHFIVHRDNTCDAAAASSWSGGGKTQPEAGSAAYGSGLLPSGCVNARELTAIVYFNPDWVEADGGCLRCHVGTDAADDTGETATVQRDIEPVAGRLVVFRSRELLHEVRPTWGRRVAMSLWMLKPALAQADTDEW